MGKTSYKPQSLVGGNTIDTLAIIRKDCWSCAGGYASMRPQGWEDFDFWCRLAERTSHVKRKIPLLNEEVAKRIETPIFHCSGGL
jgi:hypothetical protein